MRPDPQLRRTADIVFPAIKLAIFIDGCFWHGCELHYAPSKSNIDYWEVKIEANRRRDRETTAALEAHSWSVARFWSHEAADVIAVQIRELVRDLRERRVTSVVLAE